MINGRTVTRYGIKQLWMSRLLLLRHIINTFNKKEHTHEDVAKYTLMSKTNIFILDVGSKQSRPEHQYDANVFKVMTQACCYWVKLTSKVQVDDASVLLLGQTSKCLQCPSITL
jgi:hypothetical protein